MIEKQAQAAIDLIVAGVAPGRRLKFFHAPFG
jgi:hypothetical protein